MKPASNKKQGWALLLLATALGLPLLAGLLVGRQSAPELAPATTADPARVVAAAGSGAQSQASGRLVRDGVVIDFEARSEGDGPLVEGGFADLRFRLSDAASGQPLQGQVPGAWLDLAQPSAAQPAGSGTPETSSKSRIGLYLKGLPGVRPTLDLNSYYLFVLNQDPSITVIDPLTSVGGVTSTLTRIALRRPPMDWAASADGKRLFVSMPDAGEVAVVDAENFRVLGNVAAGREPVRVALQPDGRYLWVGNNARAAADSGVTVIDTQTLQTVLSARLGPGHHEIAFSDDSRRAFVSSRDAGTLTVFDVATLKPVDEIRTGPHPLAVAFSPLSRAVYVSDGQDGTVSVIDADSLKTRKTIALKRGIGPLRFTQDGRYGFVLNTLEDSATVIDAASGEVLHTLQVSAEPWQITFSRAFAYIRGLASPRVTMVDLASLGGERTPGVLGFDAGPAAPKQAGALPLAPGLATARDDAAVFVVNPVDNTTYFYMEGMNAPMSGYPNRGHSARAVTVIDRSLQELEPGVFGARVKLPAAGRFEVAVLLNQPQITHCFSAEVQADPLLARERSTPRVEFLLDNPTVSVGAPVVTRLRVVQGDANQPRSGVTDLRVRYFLAPSSRPREVAAREVGEGLYEATVELPEAGAWYLHAGSASLGLAFGDQPYVSLRATAAKSVVAEQKP
ncbi:40-residue YVTN family beta-propeller repeat-containing protein [Geopseudomonas sagittaria]|uniref:40-residue YVTN family beta-propeller repeat-containing protein n=1 Tax=Geopseudomonas sagittaria TaxID=1135990 RepID=A0A1I5Q496_9GAMM|nr:40-residue YVTN family beta-propeller repeat-containing protein [Pseudomonas sagittaria]